MSPSQDLVKIKCPSCGAVLRVNSQSILNPQGKSITCPKCAKKSPLTTFIFVSAEATHVGKTPDLGEEKKTTVNDPGCVDGHTIMPGDMPGINRKPMCVLRDVRSGRIYHLVTGLNVVGRDCSSSQATIRINTGNGQQISREHLDITVDYNPLTGHNYYVKLHKQKVNETKVESPGAGGAHMPPQHAVLNFYDTLVLKPGDLIHLPDSVTLRLEVFDSESTEAIPPYGR